MNKKPNKSENFMLNLWKKRKYELIGTFILLCLSNLVGLTSSFSQESFSWYRELNKPAFTPYNGIFGPAWMLLYCMIGWVAGSVSRVWRQHKPAFFILLSNIALNLSWSPLFFYFKRIDWAFYCIIAMIGNLALFFIVNTKNKIWNLQLLPYLFWILFAGFLNFWIWHLN